MLVGLRRFIRGSRLLLIFLALVFVLLLLLFVVAQDLCGGLVLRSHETDEVLRQFRVVQLDAGRLVVSPLVVGGRLVNDRGCVGPVRSDGYDCEKHGENRGLDSDALTRRVLGVSAFMMVDFEL